MSVIDFLQAHLSQIVELVLLLLIAVVQVIKYGKVSKQTKIALQEVEMKYRKEDYKAGQSSPAQHFDSVVPEYQLDDKTNTLVVVGTKDLQEIVQSSADCALKKVLDKFGGLIPEGYQMQEPPVSSESDQINVIEVKEDLDYYQEVLDFQESLRERYHFADGMSLPEMMAQLDGMQKSVNADIQAKLSKQQKEVQHASSPQAISES